MNYKDKDIRLWTMEENYDNLKDVIDEWVEFEDFTLEFCCGDAVAIRKKNKGYVPEVCNLIVYNEWVVISWDLEYVFEQIKKVRGGDGCLGNLKIERDPANAPKNVIEYNGWEFNMRFYEQGKQYLKVELQEYEVEKFLEKI